MAPLAGQFDRSMGAAGSSEISVEIDGHIYNRHELLPQLGLNESNDDGQLILAAFKKWGDMFCRRFIGEFSFVIKDLASGRLIAGRDALGVKPFHYHVLQNKILYGSHISFLSKHPEYRREPDERMVLASLIEDYSDQERTFYRGIKRLSPGHILIFDKNGFSVRKYFDFDPGPVLQNISAAECAEMYRETLTEALNSRIRIRKKTGVLVSGGIDSSVLISMGSRLSFANSSVPLESYSLRFREDAASDQGTLDLLNGSGAWKPNVLETDQIIPRLKISSSLDDDLVFYPSFAMFFPLFEEAQKSGIKEVWMGAGADELLSLAPAALADLFMQRKFSRLIQEMKLADRVSLRSAWSYAIKPNLPAKVIGRFRKFIKPKPPPWVNPRALENDDMLERTAELYRSAENIYRDWTRRGRYQRLFVSGIYPFVFEQHALGAAAYDLSMGYPYLDMRLVNLAFRLPLERLLWSHGGKQILRDAARGYLPDQVRLKPKFQDYTGFATRVTNLQRPSFEPWLKNSLLVKKGMLNESYRDRLLRFDHPDEDVNVLYHVIHLEKWLRSF